VLKLHIDKLHKLRYNRKVSNQHPTDDPSDVPQPAASSLGARLGIEPNRLYSTTEVATLLNVEEATVRNIITGRYPSVRRLKATRVGRSYRILGADLTTYIEAEYNGKEKELPDSASGS